MLFRSCAVIIIYIVEGTSRTTKEREMYGAGIYVVAKAFEMTAGEGGTSFLDGMKNEHRCVSTSYHSFT